MRIIYDDLVEFAEVRLRCEVRQATVRICICVKNELNNTEHPTTEHL